MVVEMMEVRMMMVVIAEMVVASTVYSNEDGGYDVKWKC